MVRVFFATDIHGSEICWRKFLNGGKHYAADAIVLGGDMTGKALVPVVHDGGERWHATLSEQRTELEGMEAVERFEAAVMRRGYYPFRTTPEAILELEEDEGRVEQIFHERMLETVEGWMALADERLAGSDIRCFVCPGNDDQFEVDEIVARSSLVELAEGRAVELEGFQMISTGWANRTPWHTYREEDEAALSARIGAMIEQLTAAPERTVFNFHCPPYSSGLDDAPELDENLKPRYAGRSPVPCGSTAVRDAIERHQPALSLHGHIHEARGTARLGRTLAINPGSSYEEGQLLGAVVDLDGKKRVKRFMLTSG